MRCDVCGFDYSGASLGKSGRCEGCGTPLGPSSDHERPNPGISVSEYDGPYVVSDEERRRDPKLDGRVLIRECDIRWGRGIGAETYGYYLKRLEEVVYIANFSEEECCPECGGLRAVHERGFDGAVAGYERLHCQTCEHEFIEEFWC